MSTEERADLVVRNVIHAINVTKIPDELNLVYSALADRALEQMQQDESVQEILSCMVARLMLLVSRQNYSVPTYSLN